jgi:single-stranded DNA-binding protein
MHGIHAAFEGQL